MNSQTQYAFLSILLGLVMFFAYLSTQPKETVIELGSGAICPKHAFCHFSCGSNAILFTQRHQVKFKGNTFNVNEFIENLIITDKNCESLSISISSDAGVKHGAVVNLSNEIKLAVNDIDIHWINSGN